MLKKFLKNIEKFMFGESKLPKHFKKTNANDTRIFVYSEFEDKETAFEVFKKQISTNVIDHGKFIDGNKQEKYFIVVKDKLKNK